MMGEREITTANVSRPREDQGESAETSRLEADIAQTREQIGSTIEALQQKLSPSALAEHAKTAVREATIGKVENMVHEAEETISRTGHSIFDTIRENPVPAAMAGFGLAWLLMSRRRPERYGYRPIKASLRRTAGDVAHRAERVADDVAHRAEEIAEDVADKAEDLAGRAGSSVTEAARAAGEKVKRVARRAEEEGRRLENRAEDAYYDNPLAVGAVFLAAGAAIGLAIPISRKEEEWMGRARDQVVDKASRLAQEALGKVEDVAKDVGGTVEKALASEQRPQPRP